MHILIPLIISSGAYGASFPGIVDLSSPEDVDMRKILGGSSGDLAGHALAGGDIDGDGYDDVIIGAYGDDPVMRSNAGMVNVFFGGPTALTGSAIDLGNPPPAFSRFMATTATIMRDTPAPAATSTATAETISLSGRRELIRRDETAPVRSI